VPSFFDACAGVTSGTANPFMTGLNDMGSDTGATTNAPGQTGNILSGLQIFTDSLCGFASRRRLVPVSDPAGRAQTAGTGR
jgi:hypothetical protein